MFKILLLRSRDNTVPPYEDGGIYGSLFSAIAAGRNAGRTSKGRFRAGLLWPVIGFSVVDSNRTALHRELLPCD